MTNTIPKFIIARVLKKHEAPVTLRPGNTVVDLCFINKLNIPTVSSHLSA
jgi:hypothetical protein